MSAPFFYVEDLSPHEIILDEDTSKHIVQVLRMGQNEMILLTDGKGNKARAVIWEDNRKKCLVRIEGREKVDAVRVQATIAVSLIKNASRFEWFLEKATEIGVHTIIPLICQRTEKEKFRFDRFRNIIISAMLQSQQSWLPHLEEPVPFQKLISSSTHEHKFIAHCHPERKGSLTYMDHMGSNIVLIGPEGDFTSSEVAEAIEAGFVPVALGGTRLRTETAGIVAAALLCNA